MESPRRGHRDILQNIAIVVLSLSAVLLFAQSQIYNLISGQSSLSDRLVGTAVADTAAQAAVLTAPVRVVVTGAYDRYGAYLTTDAEPFSDLGLLLKEALGSAGTLATCSQADFVSALESVSVYYDFLSPLPLSILAELVGDEGDSDFGAITARQLTLSARTGDVRLYIWDGSDTYLSCQIPPLSAEDLEETVNSSSFDVASFAFDEAEQNPACSRIAPRSLLLAEVPTLPVLSASNPLASTDEILIALGFNPSTKNRYSDSSGTEIIRETDRSLQIRSSGTIVYESGEEPTVEIKAEEDVPTLEEAVDGTAALLRKLLGDLSGEASLYLESVRQTGEVTTLHFGYHVDGIPIRFSDGGTAAEVTLTGATVTELSLRFRQYTASTADSSLLPLRQALAIAADEYAGKELSIGYADNGASVSAQWLAE